MADNPANKTLIRFGQHSAQFSDSLRAAMATSAELHPLQVEGLSTHLTRIQAQLAAALETLTAIKATTNQQHTQSPSGSH